MGLSRKDRALIAVARWALRRIELRCSEAEQRVWWFRTLTVRPQARMWGNGDIIEGWPDGVKAGSVQIGFGGSEAEAWDDPLLSIYMTRPMFDMLVDGAVGVRALQDKQVANLREERRLS